MVTRVHLERPSARRETEFLAAALRSRALHRGFVDAPSTAHDYRDYLQRARAEQQRSFLVIESASGELAGVININDIVRNAEQSARLGYYAFTPLAGKGLLRAGLALVIGTVFLNTTFPILSEAVARSLKNLHPEDRYLLSSYFLDRQTILQIGQILGVHESTISRRLKRVAADLRKQLLVQLQASGLSKRAAEEALDVDPRDIEINMRTLLQTSQIGAFSDKKAAGETAPASAAASDSL